MIIFRSEEPAFIEKKDTRYISYKKHSDKYGFSPSECWNLQYVIACFIYPRIKHFRECCYSYPPRISMEEWQQILLEIEQSFALVIKSDERFLTEEESNKVDKGLKLFAEYYQHLWD